MKGERAKRFIDILLRRFKGTEVPSTSVMIAYYLLLSLFPLLIAIGNLLSLFGVDVKIAMEYVRVAVPDPIEGILLPIVEGLLTGGSGGLLSISAVVALWSASRGITYIQKGLNKAYGIQSTSNYLAKRLVSLVTIMLVLVLLVAFVLLFSLGEMLLEALSAEIPGAGGLLSLFLGLKWPVTLLFMFLLLLIIYRVTPDVKLRIRDAAPGALLATVGLSALVQVFTIYIQFSTRSFSSYGALSAFFVMMFWLHFSMGIVLVGAVLNASISEYRFGQAAEEVGRVDAALERATQRLLGRLRGLFFRKKQRPGESEAPPAAAAAGTAGKTAIPSGEEGLEGDLSEVESPPEKEALPGDEPPPKADAPPGGGRPGGPPETRE